MKSNEVNVFDFDDTLFRVPNFTCSEATGMHPYEWFDNPASLRKPVNVVPILNVIEKTWNESSTNYLITHRVKACEQEVTDLLVKSGCLFKRMLFLGREDRKALKLLEILDENPNIEVLNIYEDSLYELLEYAKILEDADLNIPINFIFVDKSKIIRLDYDTFRMLLFDDNIEKIRLI